MRVKGDAKYLTDTPVRKSMKNAKIIKNIKKELRVVKYSNIMRKMIYTNNKKKKNEKHEIEIKNDCVLVTNLPLSDGNDKYSDADLLEAYKSRWDVEVFFKQIKYNFKFQHTGTKDRKDLEKMYFSELIIFYKIPVVTNN